MRFSRHLEVLPAFELFFKKIDRVLKFLSVFLAISGIFALSVLFFPSPVQAADNNAQNSLTERTVIRGSGYPVPRFVTLKKDLAYMRVGPGREYPLDWVYVRENLPLKVISEFDVWRKVVDHEGTTGWLHSSLLSLKRYGLITKAEVKLYAEPDDTADIVAIAGRNILLEVQYCEKQWCKLATDQVRGWTTRQNFWGVLEDEEVN